MRRSLLISVIGLGVAWPAPAQSPRTQKSDDVRLREAIDVVNRVVENQKKAGAEVANENRQSTGLQQKAAAAAERLAASRKSGAASEDKEIVARLREAKKRLDSSPTPPGTPPVPSPGTSGAAANAANPAGDMVITAEDEGFWSAVDSVAIFVQNVVVNRPDLRIWCDVLELSMIPPADETEGAKPPEPGKGEQPKSDAAATLNEESLKQAIAKAIDGVVVIRRRTEKGEVVATCREAVYDGPTGNIVLKQRPELIQDLKLHVIGTDDSAVITLFKDGNIRMSKRPEMAYIQPSAGREIRRRLLNNIPVGQRAAGTDAPDTGASEAPLATPPPGTPPGTPPLPPAPLASPLKANQ